MPLGVPLGGFRPSKLIQAARHYTLLDSLLNHGDFDIFVETLETLEQCQGIFPGNRGADLIARQGVTSRSPAGATSRPTTPIRSPQAVGPSAPGVAIPLPSLTPDYDSRRVTTSLH